MPQLPVPTVRLAEPSDARPLGVFECSTGAWYEDEVEEFIQRHALAYARDRADLDHRLLLFETEAKGWSPSERTSSPSFAEVRNA